MVLNPKDDFASEAKSFVHALRVWTLYGIIDVFKGQFFEIEAARFAIGEELPARWIGETPRKF